MVYYTKNVIGMRGGKEPIPELFHGGNAFVATPHIQTVDSCNGIGNCNGSPGGGSGNSGGGDRQR